jgi:hypothetical protein
MKSKPKRARGRPSLYTAKLAGEICDRIADGASLRAICADIGVERRTVLRWLSAAEHEDFRRHYARAREAQADYLADEMVWIADTDPDSNRARVRIDARKWMAARMSPRKYGEKATLEHGIDPGNPLANFLARVQGNTLPVAR